MKFLLLGGIGYLGGRLALYLKSKGHHVRITTRRSLATVPPWVEADEVVRFDLAGGSELEPYIAESDMVVHLAGPNEISAGEKPLEALKAGGEITWSILQGISQINSPPPLLYLSTFHVYGKNAYGDVRESTLPVPTHPYALGRYIGEGAIQVFRQRNKVSALCVRLSNAFGAPAGVDVPRWSLVFNDLCRQAVNNRKLVLKTAGTQRRNFITLHDTVRALEFFSIHRGNWPLDGVIHLGSHMHLSILEVAKIVAGRAEAVLGFKPPVIVQEAVGDSPDRDFKYNIDRLLSLGFSFTGKLEKEVDDTLLLCAEAK